jgi:pimeloyl-ACP methyl ester carboxylesterase
VERVIRAAGIELATEAFGDPSDPPVLLIMGLMASMLWWPAEFCTRLARSGRYVIRYDNRDTGLSTNYEPGRPTYTFADMADDAIRILDGYRLTAAHIAGMSMGGMLAQLVALRHPRRVLTLTVLSSSPLVEDGSQLPSSTPAYQRHSRKFASVNWSDRSQAIGYLVEDSRQLAGTAHRVDAEAVERLAERDFDRARNFASAANHTMLPPGREKKRYAREITAPLLVIHGTEDPLFPVEHGAAFTTEVAGATLVRLAGSGHEINAADWDAIISAIVDHTADAPRSRR